MCNSLTKAAYYEDSTGFPAEKTVVLATPLSSDLNGMRQTLLFGVLESIRQNANRQHGDLQLFELGNCYQLQREAYNSLQTRYLARQRLALFMTGWLACPDWTS